MRIFRRPGSWEPPPPGLIKVNFDGACFEGGEEGGAGIIAHDSAGQTLAWCSIRIEKPVKLLLIEAIAVREAAHLVAQKSWPNVIIEGDCEILIKKLQSAKPDSSGIGPLISDCFSLLGPVSSSFTFVRRTGNFAAHSLAKHATSFVEGLSSPPNYIHEIRLADFGPVL
ncbi:UNVERIFIED_CONTAM: hypothetical protein Sradi_5263700 [Sesamum radiatum]|uniref:RNase H type-1 domain-containing protein n=1 Tax=Sesamum radiatum TaxID=300843 RepID=A0AAW2LNN8_SESRA